jgi:alpha-tubulin suppressor-like RCC1 family protein
MVMDLSGKGVVQVACGDWHTSAVTREGCLYTWGDGTAGILGHGTPHRQWAPKRVERPLEGVTITLVTSGPYHTAAVASNGARPLSFHIATCAISLS